VTGKVALCAAACCGMAFAQLALSPVSTGLPVPVSQALDLGSVETGDSLTIALQVTNTSSAFATLSSVTLSGVGFTAGGLPDLPLQLATGASQQFQLVFAPGTAGAYSGTLTINDTDSYTLVAHATGATLLVQQGSGMGVLSAGATVDFGSVVRGSSVSPVSLSFRIDNPTGQAIQITMLSVTGDAAFSGPLELAALPPFRLDAGKSAAFRVAFSPQKSGTAAGTLTLNGRTVQLTGTATDPSFPTFHIVCDPPVLASGQQAKVSIKFDAPAPVSGSSTLDMQFLYGKGDPTLLFITPAGRSAPFTVAAGTESALFSGQTTIDFQTGTTAGTIIFTATLGGQTETLSLVIPAAPVSIDSIRTVFATGQMTVSVSAFDNTRSASQVSFTFRDASGTELGAGMLTSDVTSAFQQYFQNPEAGGNFVLRGAFSVSGDATQVKSVDVGMVNSAGTGTGSAKITE